MAAARHPDRAGDAQAPAARAPRSSRPRGGDLFAPSAPAEDRDRALIAQLIAATRLYDTEAAIQDLLAFAIRLREFAPFNAMLLHIQKPGLTHAATAQDWWDRFGNVPKMGARPLLTLRAMGPVDFVFDILDVEGEALPDAAFSFPTLGAMTEARFERILGKVTRHRIKLVRLRHGDASAGWIGPVQRSPSPSGKQAYTLGLNVGHPVPIRFTTLAHLVLGHLGEDKGRRVPDRRHRSRAEMAAVLVARRSGMIPRSETYLANYRGALDRLDLYGVTRAANAVEACMGIASHQLRAAKA